MEHNEINNNSKNFLDNDNVISVGGSKIIKEKEETN